LSWTRAWLAFLCRSGYFGHIADRERRAAQ
jgi:hypothetical protein